MLKDIQKYLETHGRACVGDLAVHLGADQSAIQPMLEMLAARGRIRRVDGALKNCGGCVKCLPSSLVLWEWTGGPGGGNGARDHGSREAQASSSMRAGISISEGAAVHTRTARTGRPGHRARMARR